MLCAGLNISSTRSIFAHLNVFGHISLNYCPIFKIEKVTYSAERACRQQYHGCRQNSLPVVDMTTDLEH